MRDLKITHFGGFKNLKLSQINNPEKTLLKGGAQLPEGKWWVSAGTAIGLYRDGDFIPSDTDIDVGVLAVSGQKHIQINGMRLIRTVEWRNRVIQTAYIDDSTDCIFDIFYYYTDLIPNKLVSVSEYGWVYHQKLFIIKPLFDILELDTKYGKLPFLNPIDEYLKDRFGENWRIPSSSKGKYDHANL